MADPFDLSTQDPNSPGMFGLPASTWQDLARFGANLAAGANARTASGHLANGTGFAGPLGAATVATMDAGRQNALSRSLMARQGAETQGLQLGNQLAASQLPLAIAKNKQLLDIYNNPQMMRELMDQMNGKFGPQSSAGPSSSPGGTPGLGGVAASPPAEFMPFYQEASARTGIPVNVLAAQGAQESGFNPNAVGGAGEIGIHQIKPSTATNPGFGMTGVDPKTLADPRTNINFAADYLKARAGPRTDFSNPATVDAALTNYNGGGDPNYVANVRRRMGGQPDMAAAAPTGNQAGPRAPQGAPASYQVASNAPMAPPTPVGENPNAQVQIPPPTQAEGVTGPQIGMRTAQATPGRPQQQQAQQPTTQPTTPSEAATLGRQYLQEADRLRQQADAVAKGKFLGIPTQRDEASLRASAQDYQQKGLALMSAGPAKAAKSAASNVELRSGAGAYIIGPDGKRVWKRNPQVERIQLPDGNHALVHVSPPPPDSPPGTPGESTPIVDENGKQIIEKRPMQEAFAHERGEKLGEQFDKIDHDAASAVEGNYLFDNMRRDAKGFDMGKFAEWEGSGRAWLSAIANKLDIKTPELNNKLADFQAFTKSSGALLRTAVHDTSSRAAVQEYNLIGDTLPRPTTSEQGFGQVADQWQALYDFRLAKQKFASGYEGSPSKLNVDFNSKVSPTSFMLNRMAQTPQGKSDMQNMLAKMSDTPEGKLIMQRMLHQYTQTKKLGLFDDLAPTGSTPVEQAPLQ